MATTFGLSPSPGPRRSEVTRVDQHVDPYSASGAGSCPAARSFVRLDFFSLYAFSGHREVLLDETTGHRDERDLLPARAWVWRCWRGRIYYSMSTLSDRASVCMSCVGGNGGRWCDSSGSELTCLLEKKLLRSCWGCTKKLLTIPWEAYSYVSIGLHLHNLDLISHHNSFETSMLSTPIKTNSKIKIHQLE